MFGRRILATEVLSDVWYLVFAAAVFFLCLTVTIASISASVSKITTNKFGWYSVPTHVPAISIECVECE